MNRKPTARAQWLIDNSTTTRTDCFTWPFHRAPSGHPFIKYKGVSMGAGRAMCIIAHGEPDDPKFDAAHSCGNGHLGCLNPNHLSWKTHKANMADRHEHGTHYMGQQNPRALFTNEQVADIKARLLDGEIGNQIAKEYGVTRSTIYHMKHGTRWAHIQPSA